MEGTNCSLELDSAHSMLHTTEVDDCDTDKLWFSTTPGTNMPKVLTKYFVRRGAVLPIGGWDKIKFMKYWESRSLRQKNGISVMAWFDVHKPKHLALINGLFSFVAIAIVTLTIVILSIHHPYNHSYLLFLYLPLLIVPIITLVYLGYNQFILRKFDQWFKTNGSESARRYTHNKADDTTGLLEEYEFDIHHDVDTDNSLNLGPDDGGSSGTEGDLRQFKGHDTLGDKVQKTTANITSILKRNSDNKASDITHLLKDDESYTDVDIHHDVDTDNSLNLGPDDGGSSGTEGDLRQFKGHKTFVDKVRKTTANITSILKRNSDNKASDITHLLKDDESYTDVDIHHDVDTDNSLNLGPDDGGSSGTEGDLRQFKGHKTFVDKVQKTTANITSILKRNSDNKASDITHLLKDDESYTDVDIHHDVDTDNSLNLGPDDGGSSGTEGDLRQFKGHKTFVDKVQKTTANITSILKRNPDNKASDTTHLLKDDGSYTDVDIHHDTKV